MGAIFGGGSSTPTYIPVSSPVKTSVDADKSASDNEEKLQRQLAAKTNTSNNVVTSPLGDSSDVSVQNKVLLGQ